MGNETKNVAHRFKFPRATFSQTMSNVFWNDGQCFLERRAMFFTLTVELFKREVGTQALVINGRKLLQQAEIIPTLQWSLPTQAI